MHACMHEKQPPSYRRREDQRTRSVLCRKLHTSLQSQAQTHTVRTPAAIGLAAAHAGDAVGHIGGWLADFRHPTLA